MSRRWRQARRGAPRGHRARQAEGDGSARRSFAPAGAQHAGAAAPGRAADASRAPPAAAPTPPPAPASARGSKGRGGSEGRAQGAACGAQVSRAWSGAQGGSADSRSRADADGEGDAPQLAAHRLSRSGAGSPIRAWRRRRHSLRRRRHVPPGRGRRAQGRPGRHRGRADPARHAGAEVPGLLQPDPRADQEQVDLPVRGVQPRASRASCRSSSASPRAGSSSSSRSAAPRASRSSTTTRCAPSSWPRPSRRCRTRSPRAACPSTASSATRSCGGLINNYLR